MGHASSKPFSLGTCSPSPVPAPCTALPLHSYGWCGAVTVRLCVGDCGHDAATLQTNPSSTRARTGAVCSTSQRWWIQSTLCLPVPALWTRKRVDGPARRLIFVSDAEVDRCAALLDSYRAGNLPASTSSDDLWYARKGWCVCQVGAVTPCAGVRPLLNLCLLPIPQSLTLWCTPRWERRCSCHGACPSSYPPTCPSPRACC